MTDTITLRKLTASAYGIDELIEWNRALRDHLARQDPEDAASAEINGGDLALIVDEDGVLQTVAQVLAEIDAFLDPRRGRVMTANPTANDLRAVSWRIRAHQANARRLELKRNELVRQAIAAGWAHARIAETTGLTRGRIGQLAVSRDQ